MTFTHPEFGSRTIVLVRRLMSAEEETYLTAGDSKYDDGTVPITLEGLGEFILAELVVEPMARGVGRGFDELTGARYEQHRNYVLVDFTTPESNLTGRFILQTVNGLTLPATTWFPRNRPCEIATLSGFLFLEKGNYWKTVLTELERCDSETRRLPDRVSEGIFSIRDDRLVLESGGFVDVGVIQGDRIEVTAKGQGFRHGQKASYSYTGPR